MFWVRCAVALFLAPILSGEVIASGLGVYGDQLTLLFPYLWLFLAADHLIQRWHWKDEQVFVMGTAFGLLYAGVYTMALHDGTSPLGINWGAMLAAPAEWGMFLVLLFRVLGVVFPRSAGHFKAGKAGWGVLAAIGLLAAGRYYVRLANGTFIVERMVGGTWPLIDLVFVGSAAALVKRGARESAENAAGKSVWVWVLCGASLWALGASLVGQVFGGGMLVLGQAGWCLALAAAGLFVWESKGKGAARWLMWAAVVRVIGALAFAVGEGVSGRPQAQFLASLFIDLPTRLLFCYGFLAG